MKWESGRVCFENTRKLLEKQQLPLSPSSPPSPLSHFEINQVLSKRGTLQRHLTATERKYSIKNYTEEDAAEASNSAEI